MTSFNINKFPLDDRKALTTLAKVAEVGERYDDMSQFMNALVKSTRGASDLSVEERNLLSVAYKNVIGARRAAWRTLNTEETQGNPLVATYRGQLEAEMTSICKEVLGLLETTLVPATKNKGDESQVFFLKMTGDYFRYMAEFAPGAGHETKATEYYKMALEVAQEKLPPTNPIRLGLALNYSVCMYEIQKDPTKACALAKQAFDDAISKLDQLDEGSYKDSTLIMQLLRDNLTLWTSEQQDALQVEDVH